MADLFAGIDIASMLQSQGPVVKCVLLKAGNTTKPVEPTENKRIVLSHLVEEIEVDTTPKKNMVHQILGGKFTFLGQYEDEGIVLMVRNTDDIQELPINPHVLQPPLDDTEVRGDILVMKVTTTDEILDNDDKEEKEDAATITTPTNDEFFLDYTKADYIAFAERTDVVAPEPQEDDEDYDEEDSDGHEENSGDGAEESGESSGEDGDKGSADEQGEDEEWDGPDDDDEETRTAMMNMIMRQVLRRFHEGNGRGPNTQELLDLRSAVAEKVGVQVPDIIDTDWDQKAKRKRETVLESDHDPKSPYKSILTRKRTSSDDAEDDEQLVSKKVKFGEELEDDEAQGAGSHGEIVSSKRGINQDGTECVNIEASHGDDKVESDIVKKAGTVL